MRIREARERAGLTQRQLAAKAKLGGGQSIIGKWERGVFTPNPDSLEILAEALGVAVSELYNGEVSSEVTSGLKVDSGDERRVLDAARRLSETLTDAWRKGQFDNPDQLRSTAREIARGYPDVGRGYIEAWLDLFKNLGR